MCVYVPTFSYCGGVNFESVQLFEKIMCLDIEERHLLRLGHGEEELATEKDFSRYGRVNFILALRMELLKEVERLQVSQIITACSPYQALFQPCTYKAERRLDRACTDAFAVYTHVLLIFSQESLGVGGDVSYTCETAGHFFLYQIMARWEKYSSKVKALANNVGGVVGVWFYHGHVTCSISAA